MNDLVTFDDFLDEEPDTKISIKRDKKVVKAPAPFRGPDYRDTRAKRRWVVNGK